MKTVNPEIHPLVESTHRVRYSANGARMAALFLGLGVAACAQPGAQAPTALQSQQAERVENQLEQVQSYVPSVAYRYVTAQDLERSKQSAAAYCNLQQSIPRLLSNSTDLSGAKTVGYGCLRVSPIPSQIPDYNPNLGYNQMSEEELKVATANADNYCRNNGGHRLIANVTQTSSGGKAVKFECSSP